MRLLGKPRLYAAETQPTHTFFFSVTPRCRETRPTWERAEWRPRRPPCPQHVPGSARRRPVQGPATSPRAASAAHCPLLWAPLHPPPSTGCPSPAGTPGTTGGLKTWPSRRRHHQTAPCPWGSSMRPAPGVGAGGGGGGAEPGSPHLLLEETDPGPPAAAPVIQHVCVRRCHTPRPLRDSVSPRRGWLSE